MTAPTPHTDTHRDAAGLRLPAGLATPVYILDVALLKRNLATAARIKTESGAKILLATKAFALPAAFPIMREVLDGTTASGEYEARMGKEDFGKEVHVYSPAYSPGEVERLTKLAHHIYFNSPEQIAQHLTLLKTAKTSIGLRINPGYSRASVGGDLYNPCAPYSRFGATRDTLAAAPWDDIDVLHAHALCEATHEGSVGLIRHIAKEFAPYIRKVKTVNFGGGHFINKPGYDVAKLIAAIPAFKQGIQRRGLASNRVPASWSIPALLVGSRHRPAHEREDDRHSGCLGFHRHAGRARGALHAARRRRGKAGRARPRHHPRRQNLHDRRHHRRIFLCRAS